MQMQEELYKQRDVQWQKEYQKLYAAYEELNKETIERDYEEFKAPDTNNDDMITRSEFNIYVKKYLSSFPELSERDFPRFEEFDLDGDGVVSFEEWQQFLYLQKQKEAAAAQGGRQQKGQVCQNFTFHSVTILVVRLLFFAPDTILRNCLSLIYDIDYFH